MNFIIAMWAIWGVLVVFVLALYIYRSRLTRDEEDELYLGEAFAAERAHQEQIKASVARIEPTIRMARWVVLAATLFVVVFYIHDFLVQFK
jgi:type VI protein secretion system component VasF